MQLSLIGEQASRLVQVFLQLGGISALPIYIEQYTPHVTRMPLLGCNGHPASLFKLFGEALLGSTERFLHFPALRRTGVDLALQGGGLALGTSQFGLSRSELVLGGEQFSPDGNERFIGSLRPCDCGLSTFLCRQDGRTRVFPQLRQRVLRGGLSTLPKGATVSCKGHRDECARNRPKGRERGPQSPAPSGNPG